MLDDLLHPQIITYGRRKMLRAVSVARERSGISELTQGPKCNSATWLYDLVRLSPEFRHVKPMCLFPPSVTSHTMRMRNLVLTAMAAVNRSTD